MRGAKLGLFVLMFFLVAPVVVTAYSGDACVPYSAGSWMDNLTVVQLFDSPNDNKWQGAWDPRYDADWQRDYCDQRQIFIPSSKLGFDSPTSPQ
jgi:hypothetical protein